MAEHRIRTSDEDTAVQPYWLCSCGVSGSGAADQLQAASQRHLDEG